MLPAHLLSRASWTAQLHSTPSPSMVFPDPLKFALCRISPIECYSICITTALPQAKVQRP